MLLTQPKATSEPLQTKW